MQDSFHHIEPIWKKRKKKSLVEFLPLSLFTPSKGKIVIYWETLFFFFNHTSAIPDSVGVVLQFCKFADT